MITVLLNKPNNNIERVFLTFIMIINTGVFGYSINVCKIIIKLFFLFFYFLVGRILDEANEGNRIHKNELNILNKYLK